jgi:hypothetical protein
VLAAIARGCDGYPPRSAPPPRHQAPVTVPRRLVHPPSGLRIVGNIRLPSLFGDKTFGEVLCDLLCSTFSSAESRRPALREYADIPSSQVKVFGFSINLAA